MAWLGAPPKWSGVNPVHVLVAVVLLLVAVCIAFALWLRNTKQDTTASSNNTLGNNTLGNNTLGNNALGNYTLGNYTLGNNALGNNTLGNNTLGNNALGNNASVSPSKDNDEHSLANEETVKDALRDIKSLVTSSMARLNGDGRVGNMVDSKGQSRVNKVPVEVKIEEPKEVVCELKFVTSLVFPCVVRDLNIKNCISAEVVSAVIPRTDYTVKSAWLDVKATGQLTFVRTTIPDGIYDILELLAALTHAVSTSGYSGDAASTSLLYLERTSKVVVVNQAMEDFVMNMSDRLAYMLGMEASSIASSNAQVVGTRRVDLSGARSVIITTTQFSEHKENILQEVPLDVGESVWENTHLDETERIFTPRNVHALNLNVMVKYPNFAPVLEVFDANGVAIDITIRFKCLRYAASNFVDTQLDVC